MFFGNKEDRERERLDGDQKDFEAPVEILRNTLHRAAERPEIYWESRRKLIMKQIQKPSWPRGRRILQIWAPAAAMVLLCLFFFGKSNQVSVVPDLAGGYDQNLLMEVERALNQDCPDAFAPAVLIKQELERAGAEAGPLK